MLKYSPGDIILISHKNSESVKCLVISIKKRHNFYEVDLMAKGKTFTIVDDGNFYNIKLLTKDEERTAK